MLKRMDNSNYENLNAVPQEPESEDYMPWAKAVDLYGREEAWRTRANCRGVDPELFYPEPGESSAPAKAVCRDCIVRLACLEYAISQHEVRGVWGGTAERERRELTRKRKLASQSSQI